MSNSQSKHHPNIGKYVHAYHREPEWAKANCHCDVFFRPLSTLWEGIWWEKLLLALSRWRSRGAMAINRCLLINLWGWGCWRCSRISTLQIARPCFSRLWSLSRCHHKSNSNLQNTECRHIFKINQETKKNSDISSRLTHSQSGRCPTHSTVSFLHEQSSKLKFRGISFSKHFLEDHFFTNQTENNPQESSWSD